MSTYYVDHEKTQYLELARERAGKLQYKLDSLWDEYYGLVDLGIKNRTSAQNRRVKYILREIDRLEKEIFNTYPGGVPSNYVFKNSKYRGRNNNYELMKYIIKKIALWAAFILALWLILEMFEL